MSKSYKQVASLDSFSRFKEIEISKTPILLINNNGRIFATSPNCSHYGAPLSKGCLSQSNNTLRCPWHGACFNLTTGDIEEGPPLDGINSYEVHLKGSDIYIAVDSNEKPLPNISKSRTSGGLQSQKVLIVGGGSAGAACSEYLRKYGFDGDITIISKESHYMIDRTKLSKAPVADSLKQASEFNSDIEKVSQAILDSNNVKLRDHKFYSDSKIKFLLDEPVRYISLAEKFAQTKENRLDFDKLVLASGSSARFLPIMGIRQGDAENVFTLRDISDLSRIACYIENHLSDQEIVVLGSGFIGVEISLQLQKTHKVNVIGREKYPLEVPLGEEMARNLMEINSSSDSNIKYYMNSEIERTEMVDSKVTKVFLKDGTELRADFVILAVGVDLSLDYLNESSIEKAPDGGLKVDENLRLEGQKDVYVIGDISSFQIRFPPANSGQEVSRQRIEHWNIALDHARAVAHHIVDGKSKSTNSYIPIFWSAQRGQLRYAGLRKSTDKFCIERENSKFFGLYYDDSTKIISAVISMNSDPCVMKVVQLWSTGKLMKKEDLTIAGKSFSEAVLEMEDL